MAEPLLQVQGLVKRFGALVATDQASFEVNEGELHALIGPNGAGKTTLIHQLSGALMPDAGSVRFAGQDLTRADMAAHVKAGLTRSYQITSIFKRLTVLDNLRLALQARRGARWFGVAERDAGLREEAEALLIRVGLAPQAGAMAGVLAHGEQRQLELALALATKPRLLLLDEPMAGMGPEEGEQMVELLLALKGRFTVLLVEHDMDAVFRLADRISTLVAGRVIATGSPDEIRNHPEVKAAYLGDEVHA
ncbi:ABC transporter ATP-binding protein [Pelomonas sp. SE-A7]|uniref:ABC transporter ATP-binding protein n=1 Tax=Pelomonas sp. SE-A7 TaxID=3054953 RepID=UPI00259CC11A|nr:ABC transporter ATP-binding protein [Pelomonas sp. SE-A7]MDM4764633.1 ABC transporter ATP-binding protein [Pelomonas sp. SE-A7]